jgi:hypothetical protein
LSSQNVSQATTDTDVSKPTFEIATDVSKPTFEIDTDVSNPTFDIDTDVSNPTFDIGNEVITENDANTTTSEFKNNATKISSFKSQTELLMLLIYLIFCNLLF